MGKNKQQLRQIEALFVPRKNSVELAGVVESTSTEDCNVHGNRRGSGGSITGLLQKRDSLTVGSQLGNSTVKRSSVIDEETNGDVAVFRRRESVERESTPSAGDTYSWLMHRRSSSASKNGDANRYGVQLLSILDLRRLRVAGACAKPAVRPSR